jgi:N-acetylglucosamine malate deacetylase 1
MRVLAVGAHPDDIEILCAGTLLRYKALGHHITIAVATNGNQGHFEIMPEELGKMRRKEAEASAEFLGAELIWMDYNDQMLFHDEPTRMRFIEMVRQANPDVVFTHNPDDYAMDHRKVSELVFAATFMASVPHIFTESPHTVKAPPLYYMDNIAGSNFQPTEYVDISGVIEQKTEMLERHASQVKWLKEHVGTDIVRLMRVMAEFRGLSCGVDFAEGFRHLDAWGRTPIGHILP